MLLDTHTHVQTHCRVTNQLTNLCCQDLWLLVAVTISYRDNTSLGTKPDLPFVTEATCLILMHWTLGVDTAISAFNSQLMFLWRRNHRQEFQANKVTLEPWGSLLTGNMNHWSRGGGGLLNHRNVPLIRNAPLLNKQSTLFLQLINGCTWHHTGSFNQELPEITHTGLSPLRFPSTLGKASHSPPSRR